jgi:hypothetical protein
VVIFILDLIVLSILFEGLHDISKGLVSPRQYVPFNIEKLETISSDRPDSKEKFIKFLRVETENTKYFHETYMQPQCSYISKELKKLGKDPFLKAKFKDYTSAEHAISTHKRTINKYTSSYDTMLLEKISRQKKEDSIIQSSAEQVRKDIEEENRQISLKENRLKQLQTDIINHKPVTALLSYIKEHFNEIKADDSSYRFWLSAKKLHYHFVFLLPLFLAVYFLGKWAHKKSHQILCLVTGHLLVVISIPMVGKIFEVIYDLLPKRLLKIIYDALKALNLIAIWHYAMILILICFALALVYFIQKKIFSTEKLIAKRLEKNLCVNCGLPRHGAHIHHKHCIRCGYSFITNCKTCGKETTKQAPFCGECGNKIQDN